MNANRQEANVMDAKRVNSGLLASQVTEAHQVLNMFGRNKAFTVKEFGQLVRLVELHAFREEWDRIVDIASQSIVVGLRWDAELTMYRMWIEGLKEDLDTDGLVDLGRHLLSRRRDRTEYLALATLAFTYAGRPNAVRSAIGSLYRMEAGGDVVDEVLAIVKCEAIDREERMMGLRELASTLKDSSCGYLAYRRFLDYAFENNALYTASATLKSLNKKFPDAPDAYMVSALLAVNDGEWESAMDALRVVIANNPGQSEALLMMSRCLEMIGKVSQARDFLLQNAHHFVRGDYEFSVQLGLIEKRLCCEDSDGEMRDSAAAHLKVALAAAHSYGFPTAPILSALEDIQAATAAPQAPRQRYWLLNVEPKTLAAILDRDELQLRCPESIQMGDVIFLSAEGRNSAKGQHAVSGFFTARSTPTADPSLGLTVRTAQAVVFEHDVEVSSESGIFAARDLHGLENFSNRNMARYFELDSSVADSIVNAVEGMQVRMARAG